MSSREVDEKLLNLYRSYPFLYDKDSPDFNNRKLREHVWCVISQQMGFDTRTCQNNIEDIVDRYNNYDKTRNQPSERNSSNLIMNSWQSETCSRPTVSAMPNSSTLNIPYTESVCEQMLTEDTKHVLTEDGEQGWVFTVGYDNNKSNPSLKKTVKMERNSRSSFHTEEVMQFHPQASSELFPCSICSEICHEEHELHRHMQNHMFIKPYKCNKCVAAFPSSKMLNNHIIKNHPEEQQHTRQFACNFCERSFTQKSNLKAHVKIHTGEKPFSCSLCSRKFTQSSNLKEHLKIHSGERAHQCTLCPRAFTQSSNLKEHFKTHTGEKPFSCSLCSRRFTQSSNLKEHIKIHTGEKNHACSLCPRAFTQSSNLKEHFKTHTGEKPFSCSLCPRKFTQSSNLKEHIKIHSNQLEHVCAICDKSFVQLSNLKSHVSVVHRGNSAVTGAASCESSVKSESFPEHDCSMKSKNKACAVCKRAFLRSVNLKKQIASTDCKHIDA